MVDKILDQRISIITGGARGIGKAISESLAKEGCKVIIIDPGYTIDGNFDEKIIMLIRITILKEKQLSKTDGD